MISEKAEDLVGENFFAFHFITVCNKYEINTLHSLPLICNEPTMKEPQKGAYTPQNNILSLKKDYISTEEGKKLDDKRLFLEQ